MNSTRLILPIRTILSDWSDFLLLIALLIDWSVSDATSSECAADMWHDERRSSWTTAEGGGGDQQQKTMTVTKTTTTKEKDQKKQKDKKKHAADTTTTTTTIVVEEEWRDIWAHRMEVCLYRLDWLTVVVCVPFFQCFQLLCLGDFFYIFYIFVNILKYTNIL